MEEEKLEEVVDISEKLLYGEGYCDINDEGGGGGGDLDDDPSHPKPKKQRISRGHWLSKENCRTEALKYTTRDAFRKGSGSAFQAAFQGKFLEEVCTHMPPSRQRVGPGYWSKEKCIEQAQQFTTKMEFSKSCHTAYETARSKGWLTEICSHMEMKANTPRPKGHWDNKENCRQEALYHKKRSDFQKGCSGAYNSAYENDWLDEICAHMLPSRETVPRGHWNNKDNCKEEALKYSSRTAFDKANTSAFQGARRNGWLDEVCAHMK
jgi:hypothetical protein